MPHAAANSYKAFCLLLPLPPCCALRRASPYRNTASSSIIWAASCSKVSCTPLDAATGQVEQPHICGAVRSACKITIPALFSLIQITVASLPGTANRPSTIHSSRPFLPPHATLKHGPHHTHVSSDPPLLATRTARPPLPTKSVSHELLPRRSLHAPFRAALAGVA